jgi:predicted nuclease of predicted toxin-antitoxin system
MKILMDMNLSPRWVQVIEKHGWESVHWSTIGDPREKDTTIMAWATSNNYVVMTHDLDFGALLAATQANGPSVIQIRTQDILPDHLEGLVVEVLRSYQAELERGALIVVDEARARVRILPLDL